MDGGLLLIESAGYEDGLGTPDSAFLVGGIGFDGSIQYLLVRLFLDIPCDGVMDRVGFGCHEMSCPNYRVDIGRLQIGREVRFAYAGKDDHVTFLPVRVGESVV